MSNILFLVFVAVAVYVQNITGFALALILLGLVGATDLLPLPDVVNVVTVIGLVNAGLFLYKRQALHLDRMLWPALIFSLVGTVIGVSALGWLAASAYEALRLLLGISILYCSWMLWRRTSSLEKPSAPSAFLSVGLLSGLMGGLFAAAGPPLVYQLYRQPWPLARIQESLVFFFGTGALLRLIIILPTGGFNLQSLKLTALAIPVVVLVTILAARIPPPLSRNTLKSLVCILLILTGFPMIYGAIGQIAANVA